MSTRFLVSFRNINKNRTNSIITIAGLSIAFACLLLIYLYVSQELSYNNFHQNRDRLYRFNYTIKHVDGSTVSTVYLDPKLSEVLKDNVPQIKRCTAFRSAHYPALSFEDQNFEEDLCITEPDFFSMFSFKLIIGNKDNLLENPDEIVITKSLAEKFQAVSACTKEDLIGKSVFFTNTADKPFVISAIMEDVPKNSSICFSALISYKREKAFNNSCNMFGSSSIYYETNNRDDAHSAEIQAKKTIIEYYKSSIQDFQNQKIIASAGQGFSPFVLSINDAYLSHVNTDYERTVNKTSLYILSAIGLLILVIACINFSMLSLGQSIKKTGEVVIRKAMGAGHGEIFSLFFAENLLLTLIALLLGSTLCIILLPVFNQLSQNKVFTGLINVPRILVFTTIVISLVVASSSIFPAIKLTKIKSNLIASNGPVIRKKSDATNLFIILQYGLSIILIILTTSILRQTDFMKKADLGLSSENIINLQVYHLDDGDKVALMDQLKKYPGIVSLTSADRNFISGQSGEYVKNALGENIGTRILKVDHNYLPTLGLKLLQGENFKEEISKEGERSVIVNETLLGHLGFKNNAIGQIITMNGSTLRIIGVIKDFHYDSMKETIEPLVLLTNTGKECNYIFIKYAPAQQSQLISFIKTTWKNSAPDKTLDIQFWDDQLAQRYQSEERWGRIIAYAAAIALLISSLGLFGFTILGINRRVKEIGIRRVNGAKIPEVMMMLNKDFVKWVAIAIVIAVPIACYIVQKWLENFAYKTELSWWIFAQASLLALVVALLTVSWQSWKAATRNPVESLKHE